MTPAEFAVYGWMPYLERMRRIALGAAYWLALWDEHPEQEPTLV